jgi:hypothetical protein
MHGYDHRPGGFDAVPTGAWIYVTAGADSWSGATAYNPGDTVIDGLYQYLCILSNTNVEPGVNAKWFWYWVIDAPIFQNSWANVGSTLMPMRFRISIGYPNYLNKDNGSEIQGSVTGGTTGTVVFTLPPAYSPESDLRLSASDDTGQFVVFQVLATGDVIRGL